MIADRDKAAQPGQQRTYGRINGRPLSSRQQTLVETLLPAIAPPVAPAVRLDPRSLFAGEVKEVWFEIGFGGGEHLIGQAARRPDVGLIGVEPYMEGVGKALSLLDDAGLDNVRIHAGDARDVLAGLTDASLDRVFVLFPDPWPKTRHHKRRIIQHDFVAELARLVRPGGRVRAATDWSHYADWILERFIRSPDFDWTAETADDWRRPPADHVQTRYQMKGLGDCAPVFFDIRRA